VSERAEPQASGGLVATLREALRGSTQDYTEGPIGRAVLLLAVPMVAEMLLESVFAVVDVFVVAKLGADAVATVGITESVIALIYAVSMGLSMATTAMVARRTGEKDPEGAARTAVQAVAVGAGVSVLMGVPLAVFAPDLLRLLGASTAVIDTGTTYARVMFGGNATIVLLYLINAIFRGAGDAAIAMRVLWLGNAINIVLAPCLVFGVGPFPELGVTGAAVGTNVGRGIAVLFQVYALISKRGRLAIARRHLELHATTMVALMKIASSGILQVTVATASWLGLVRILAVFGSAAVAGYTIGMRIIIFALLPCFGLANAAATMVGQSLGAGKPERAERAVWIAAGYNMAFLGAMGVAFVVFAGPLVRQFSSEPEVVAHGEACLRIVSYGFVFYALGMVLEQAFNGAGDTWTPTVMNLFCFWLWEIPIAWFLSRRLGPDGVFWAIAIAFSTLAVVSAVLFRRGRWKQQRV
jgi:putative MATE family efflux protein